MHPTVLKTQPPRIAVCLIVLACVGCGDAAGEAISSREPLDMSGLDARLSRHSTGCPQQSFEVLVSTVGSDLEFPADDVAVLRPPCPEAPTPNVDVYFISNSLVFDFASLREAFSFSRASVDSFQVTIERRCGDPVIVGAKVDGPSSTLAMPAHRLESSVDRIDVNMSGMQLNPGAFLKIDFEVAEVDCANL